MVCTSVPKVFGQRRVLGSRGPVPVATQVAAADFPPPLSHCHTTDFPPALPRCPTLVQMREQNKGIGVNNLHYLTGGPATRDCGCALCYGLCILRQRPGRLLGSVGVSAQCSTLLLLQPSRDAHPCPNLMFNPLLVPIPQTACGRRRSWTKPKLCGGTLSGGRQRLTQLYIQSTHTIFLTLGCRLQPPEPASPLCCNRPCCCTHRSPSRTHGAPLKPAGSRRRSAAGPPLLQAAGQRPGFRRAVLS